MVPIKFRVNRKDGSQAVANIDKITNRKFERIAGYETILFVCEADGRYCKLKFDKSSCKWMLFKA